MERSLSQIIVHVLHRAQFSQSYSNLDERLVKQICFLKDCREGEVFMLLKVDSTAKGQYILGNVFLR